MASVGILCEDLCCKEGIHREMKLQSKRSCEHTVISCGLVLRLTFHPGSVGGVGHPFGQRVLLYDGWGGGLTKNTEEHNAGAWKCVTTITS